MIHPYQSFVSFAHNQSDPRKMPTLHHDNHRYLLIWSASTIIGHLTQLTKQPHNQPLLNSGSYQLELNRNAEEIDNDQPTVLVTNPPNQPNPPNALNPLNPLSQQPNQPIRSTVVHAFKRPRQSLDLLWGRGSWSHGTWSRTRRTQWSIHLLTKKYAYWSVIISYHEKCSWWLSENWELTYYSMINLWYDWLNME